MTSSQHGPYVLGDTQKSATPEAAGLTPWEAGVEGGVGDWGEVVTR